MIHVNERLTCSRARVDRYRRLLATDLTEVERQYVERRLAEERAAAQGIGGHPPPHFVAMLGS